jgi:alkylated DNA repair dioxygenase AlkB
MLHLFPNEKIILPLPDAVFEYYPNFIDRETADTLFEKIMQETPWQQDDIMLFGKKIPQPRLTALFGDQGLTYTYSKLTLKANKWNTPLMFIKNEIENITQLQFNAALLNLYRDEKDSNAWHADNEKELGPDPIVASVSLGETRGFQLKHNTKIDIKKSIDLEHGSLILMKEGSQLHYKHQIPKSSKMKKPRINITFRSIQ